MAKSARSRLENLECHYQPRAYATCSWWAACPVLIDDDGKRLRALEQNYPPVISPEIRACAERLAAEAGVGTDELIAEAVLLMYAAGPPYSVERFAAMIAGETGRTGAGMLAEARDRSRRSGPFPRVPVARS